MNRPVTGKPFPFPFRISRRIRSICIIYGGNGHRCRACGENIKQIFRQMPRQSYVGNPIFYFIPVAFYIRHFSFSPSPRGLSSIHSFHPPTSNGKRGIILPCFYFASSKSTVDRPDGLIVHRGRARKYKGNFILETGIAVLRVERYSPLKAPWMAA